MLKTVIALALATVALDAAAQSLVRKTDAPEPRRFESFLPAVAPSVPWLDLYARTRLPKGDYPIGRNAESAPFAVRAPQFEHADFAAFALGGG